MDANLLEAFGLDPDILHLNHGAFGVAPAVVRQAAAAWRERAERNPHRFNRVEVAGLVAAARERAAGFLGVDASRAAWVRNVSEGVSAVLGSLRLAPGDELVTSTHGYGAVRKALGYHAALAGARVVEAAYPLGAEDDVIVSAYAAACTPRTRLVVVDRITAPTATVVPVAAVAAAAAAAGAPVLVDAAHAPGHLADDIAALRRRPLGRQPAQVGVHPARQRDPVEPAGRGRDPGRARLAAGRRVRRVVRLPRAPGTTPAGWRRATGWRTGSRWAAGTPWPGARTW